VGLPAQRGKLFRFDPDHLAFLPKHGVLPKAPLAIQRFGHGLPQHGQGLVGGGVR
jgi:hypothetical protein